MPTAAHRSLLLLGLASLAALHLLFPTKLPLLLLNR